MNGGKVGVVRMQMVGALVLACILSVAGSLSAHAVSSDAAADVLASRWSDALAILELDPATQSDPVASLLSAHAKVAGNLGNEAFRVFRAERQPESLEMWSKWTGQQLTEHPDSAIALYLAADASARSGSRQSALDLLDRALVLAPRQELALLARGTLKYLADDIDGAYSDLYEAVQIKPNLSAGWVGLAILDLGQNDIASAERNASNALLGDPDFALALIIKALSLKLQGHDEASNYLIDQFNLDAGEIALFANTERKSLQIIPEENAQAGTSLQVSSAVSPESRSVAGEHGSRMRAIRKDDEAAMARNLSEIHARSAKVVGASALDVGAFLSLWAAPEVWAVRAVGTAFVVERFADSYSQAVRLWEPRVSSGQEGANCCCCRTGSRDVGGVRLPIESIQIDPQEWQLNVVDGLFYSVLQ